MSNEIFKKSTLIIQENLTSSDVSNNSCMINIVLIPNDFHVNKNKNFLKNNSATINKRYNLLKDYLPEKL